MKTHWSLTLVASGLILLSGGFVYDVLFAGIPYQDPTPEMSTRYGRHALIASSILWVGVVTFLFGAAAGVIRLVARR